MNYISIEYSGMRPNVQEAVCKTNNLLRDPRFFERIAAIPQFDMADIYPAELARLMQKTRIKMEVELYYAISPVEEIDLYDDNDNPNLIHMNIWQLDRPVASLCNTMLHSCVHALNARYSQYTFGHGDHTGGGKHHTAPYMIGALGEEMIQGSRHERTFSHDITIPGPMEMKQMLAFCA